MLIIKLQSLRLCWECWLRCWECADNPAAIVEIVYDDTIVCFVLHFPQQTNGPINGHATLDLEKNIRDTLQSVIADIWPCVQLSVLAQSLRMNR